MAVRKRTGKRGVTWQIDYTDPTGKRVRQNFKLKKDAVAEEAARKHLIAENRYLNVKKPCETTLGQMIEIYKAEYGDQPAFNSNKRLALTQNSGHTEQPRCMRHWEVFHYGKALRQRIQDGSRGAGI